LRCGQPIASPEGWILVVFRNECLRYRERRQASGERKLTFVQLAEASRPEAGPLDRVLIDEVLAGFSRLKARDQTLLRGRFFEGLSLAVLAQRLGVKPGSMKNLLARALERWRAGIGVSR
jgi:RNA polymerase sigma factor (sigma-70 family)